MLLALLSRLAPEQVGQLTVAHDALAEEQDDEHDDDRHDRHAEAILEQAGRLNPKEFAGVEAAQQPFDAGNVEEARDDGAGDRADAADDDDEQDLIGHRALEREGLHCAHVHGEHAAADAREERRDDKGEALVVREVDAHGLGGDLIVADGLEGAAVGRVNHQQDDADEDGDQNEIGPGMAKVRITFEQVGAVGDRAEGVPLEERAEDLGEAERRDGEVVGLQPKHRQTNEVRHQRGDQAADEQGDEDADYGARALAEEIRERLRQGELDEAAFKLLIDARALGDRDAEHGVGIRAEQHEARLTEGEQAREAVEQVHRDGDEGIDRGLLDDLDDDVIAGEDGVEVDARAEQNEQDDGDDERFAMQFFRHDVHLLTLYR